MRVRFTDDSLVKVGVQRLRAALYEFYLPENPMYVDGDVPGGAQTPFVFAPVDDAELLAERRRDRLARPGPRRSACGCEPESS